MNQLKIRPARRSEIDVVQEITVAAYLGFRDELSPAIFEAYIADLRNLKHTWDAAEVSVAEIDGRIGGTVSFYADASSEGFGFPRNWSGFRKLAVAPGLRGQGLGRKLASHCVLLAGELGSEAIGIHTTHFMGAAQKIYISLGFQRCPQFDVKASDFVGLEDDVENFDVLGFRLQL